jgi:hypothetical protein
MLLNTIALLFEAATLAFALPPPPFVVQGDQALNLGDAPVPELAIDDFLSIERAKIALKGTVNTLLETASTFDEDSVAGPHYPLHHSAPVLNLSDYTILEILNASLHNNISHATTPTDLPRCKPPAWSQPYRDPADPVFLPLHRLAWIVNRSTEAQESLRKSEKLKLTGACGR